MSNKKRFLEPFFTSFFKTIGEPLNPEKYAQLRELFAQAVEGSAAERDSIIAGIKDAELKVELRSLLQHSDTTQDKTIVPGALIPSSIGQALKPKIAWSRVLKGKKILRASIVIAILVFFLVVSFWQAHEIREYASQSTEGNLESARDAGVGAFQYWLEEWKSEVTELINNPMERKLIHSVLAASGAANPSDSARSNSLQSLIGIFEQQVQNGEFAVVGLADSSGFVVASAPNFEPGLRLNAEGRELVEPTNRGESVFAPPLPRGAFTGKETNPGSRLVWILLPVANDQGQVIGTIGTARDADDDYKSVLNVGRFGKSGQTYAIDRYGRIISGVRREQDTDLSQPWNEDSLSQLPYCRDPGISIGSEFPPNDSADPRLTAAAKIAIASANTAAEADGTILDAYRNFRGDSVVGAWKWLPQQNIGILSEVSVDEAFAPVIDIRRGTILLAGSIIALCGWVTYLLTRGVFLQTRFQRGQSFGSYRLQEKLGEGGMGVVYRAQHSQLSRPAAIKLIKPELATPEMISQFSREVAMASQLQHPNTIQIYDFGSTDYGVFFLAMELLEGESLESAVATQGPFPVARSIFVVIQICKSIREAHLAGIVHRDLKPSNVLISNQGGEVDFVRVVDFGLSQTIDFDHSRPEEAGMSFAGTPVYMSPERLSYGNDLDPRIDIYAIGAILYFVLSGKPIFTPANTLDALYLIKNQRPQAISQVCPFRIPAELESLVESCLDKDPEKRPETMNAILSILRPLALHHPWPST